MTRLSALLALATVVATLAAPAPRNDPAPAPLTPDHVAKLQPVGEIPIDAWELVWGPKGNELSILQWEGPAEVFDTRTLKSLRKIAGDKKLTHIALARGGDVVAWSDNATAK